MEKLKPTPVYLALEPSDAAIILREDGSFETSFPEDQGAYAPDHLLTGAAVAYALRNESLLEMIMDNFVNECKGIVARK